MVLFVPAAFSQSRVILYDGFNDIVSRQRTVRDAVEVNRSPLFDNAPFLRLRKGDKLVKAKEDVHGKGGKHSGESERTNYYLFSGERYYLIWTQEKEGKLLLSPSFHGADNCLFFDWEVTLENARALRELLPHEYARSLTIKQRDAIIRAVRSQFPDVEVWNEAMWSEPEAERLVGFSSHAWAVFEGISLGSYDNSLYHYSLRIGPEVFSVTGKLLIRGPRSIDRSEFERVVINGPNGHPGQDVAPETAKIKKAAYDRMLKFQDVVREAIKSEIQAK